MVNGPEVKIEIALYFALRYGQTDGAHHKAWVIDKMVRALTGEMYETIIKRHNMNPKTGEIEYSWDQGIAP